MLKTKVSPLIDGNSCAKKLRLWVIQEKKSFLVKERVKGGDFNALAQLLSSKKSF